MNGIACRCVINGTLSKTVVTGVLHAYRVFPGRRGGVRRIVMMGAGRRRQGGRRDRWERLIVIRWIVFDDRVLIRDDGERPN